MDGLTDVLTAISHPTRRAIIGSLATGPRRFLDVAKPFDTALNAVTKHLKLLERAGLIERRRQGREVYISFRAEPLRQVAGWVHEYERFWTERLDAFGKHFQDRAAERNGRDERGRAQDPRGARGAARDGSGGPRPGSPSVRGSRKDGRDRKRKNLKDDGTHGPLNGERR